MKKIVVTGGFGFLGRHLLAELGAKSPELAIRAIDLQAAPPAAPQAGVEYVGNVDIGSVDALTRAFEGADAVVHLAALVSFWSGDRDRLFRVNQLGTRNVVEASIRTRVKRLVHVSSVAAIGFTDREDEPADEELDFDWASVADKHYMLSKRASELELRNAIRAGISVSIANPGLLYGPGDRTNLPLFRAVSEGRMPVVPPGGTNVVDVRDVAEGLRLLLLSGERKERFILGGHNLRFSEIVRTIAGVLSSNVSPRRLPRFLRAPLYATVRAIESVRSSRPSLTADHLDSSFRFRYFSSRKAAQRLGWRPQIPFERTIADAAAELVRSGHLSRAGVAS